MACIKEWYLTRATEYLESFVKYLLIQFIVSGQILVFPHVQGVDCVGLWAI